MANFSVSSTRQDENDVKNVLLMTLVQEATKALDEQEEVKVQGEEIQETPIEDQQSQEHHQAILRSSRTSSPPSVVTEPIQVGATTTSSPDTTPLISPSPSTVSTGAVSEANPSNSTSSISSSGAVQSSLASSSSCIYRTSSSSTLFLARLRRALNDHRITSLQWMPSGDSFQIVQPQSFIDLLPSVFQLKNRSSFLRKLNAIGFCRIPDTETMNLDIFQHEQFRRDVPPPQPAKTSETSTLSSSIKQTAVVPSFSAVAKQKQLRNNPSVRRPLIRRVSGVPNGNDWKVDRSVHSMAHITPQDSVQQSRYVPKPSVTVAATSQVDPLAQVELLSRMHRMGYGIPHQYSAIPKSAIHSSLDEHRSLLLQALLNERQSLLQGMDRMSAALSSLLTQERTQQQFQQTHFGK
ncbi:HSF-type DNA-binding protein [Nitzschia inconspicua]|uniref:HSF-type DNA-binding protein n=1 Tax=Nitzschia inconspicua TaxID=303405 RepID=A0A9K3LL76_9STRA|nr:HSF-type DNA-binding protein [Nitzschia inconspicua]